MNIGYIGNGKSVNRYHLPFVLTRSDRIRVKTIYDRHPDAVKWERIEGVRYTDDLDSMLNDPQIDVIVVGLPNGFHYEYGKKVLEHGKHCVVEKPFTATSKEAQELFDLAEKKGVTVQAYQNRRFDSDFLTVQKVIESGRLGDLLEMEMHFDYYRPEVPEGQDHFSLETSFLYTHACHTLDQVVSILGTPDSVHYDVRELLGKGRMNDYFDLDLYYGSFKVSVKSSYFRVKERPSFAVYGKKGVFVKETKDRQEYDLKRFYLPLGHPDFGIDRPDDYGTLYWYDSEGKLQEERIVSEKGDYGRFYDALYETVINGSQPLVRKQQTMAVMKMLEEGISGLLEKAE